MLEHSRARRPRRSLGAALIGCLLLTFAPLSVIPAAADPAEEPSIPEGAYAATGTEVAGGSSIAQATTIEPGQYRDSFETGPDAEGEGGTVKYYKVELDPGERIHAAATIAAPAPAEGIEDSYGTRLDADLTVVTASGDSCTADSEQGIGDPNTGAGPVTATVLSGALGPEECPGSALFLRVQRRGEVFAEQPLPVEVQVAVQPAGLAAGEPSAIEPIDDDGASPVAPTDAEPLIPGRSLADPQEVGPGSVVLELTPGQSAVLSIPVELGQRLRWRTEITAAPPDAGQMSLRVHNSARELVPVGGGSWQIGAVGDIAGGGMPAPLALGNRGADDSGIASTWLPGQQRVIITRLPRTVDAESEKPEGSEPVRLILTLEVEGQAQDSEEVLDLGRDDSTLDWQRVAMLAGAGALGLLGIVLLTGGVLVLRRRG